MNECKHKNLFFWGDASLIGHYYCPDCRIEFPIEKIAEQLKNKQENKKLEFWANMIVGYANYNNEKDNE